MIEVCSLDFLRKEKFETDIMTVDGRVLFSEHDKVTPELILKLYFNKIYVSDPIIKKGVDAPYNEADMVNATAVADKAISELLSVGESGVGPRSVDSVSTEDTQVQSPILAEPSIDEINSAIEAISSSQDLSEKSSTVSSAIGVPGKSDVSSDSVATAKPVASSEPLEEDLSLKFDENQAGRVAEYSVSLGKMLGYSTAELKELEQVAYYCNYGITELKKSDMAKKEFRKMKAYASLQKLQKEKIVPVKISEMVKFTATPCESSGLTVGSVIPIDNIVAITGYYEDLLSQNDSKEATLLKMLQLGGNHFNIFVLHKFIRMMREIDG